MYPLHTRNKVLKGPVNCEVCGRPFCHGRHIHLITESILERNVTDVNAVEKYSVKGEALIDTVNLTLKSY